MSETTRQDETWRLVYALGAWRDSMRKMGIYPETGSARGHMLMQSHVRTIRAMEYGETA